MSEPAPSWGPTVVGGRRRTGRRIVAIVAVVLLAAVLAYAGVVTFALTSNITRVPVGGRAHGDGPMHVLVVGSDSREELSEEERIALTTGSADGERTDTIFVMSVQGTDIGLLAFPRDLYVERCDGSTGRINVAIQLGGATCLVETVSELSGLPIRHFVSVRFRGFHDIVEAVGGVEVCLDRPIRDPSAGIDLPAGCQSLDGADALGYVRVRKIDNDLQRIRRQQRFLRSLTGAILSPGIVADPARTVSTAANIGAALTTDRDLGVVALGRLGLGMRGLASGQALTATVPATPASRGGAAVLIPDPAAAQLFAGFRDGSALRAASDDTTVERGDVPVTVLNGSGVEGAAGDTAEALRELGWRIERIGNAERRPATTIGYPPGLRAAAELLRNDLPVAAELERDGSLQGIVLRLGGDPAG